MLIPITIRYYVAPQVNATSFWIRENKETPVTDQANSMSLPAN
jgi:hypothetical protein